MIDAPIAAQWSALAVRRCWAAATAYSRIGKFRPVLILFLLVLSLGATVGVARADPLPVLPCGDDVAAPGDAAPLPLAESVALPLEKPELRRLKQAANPPLALGDDVAVPSATGATEPAPMLSLTVPQGLRHDFAATGPPT